MKENMKIKRKIETEKLIELKKQTVMEAILEAT